ncbi:MAG: TIGR03915 family putative DNA repair protein [Clostridium sp.]|nr:TIGR03915 family putative DNA repair protein [Clostridium sp.]
MEILLYDDSFEGLLCAVYYSFYSKSKIEGIYSEKDFSSPLLLGNIISITTDDVKYKKVRDAVINKIDFLCLQKIYMVYLSCEVDRGLIVYKYLKTAFKLGKDVHSFLNLDQVRIIDEINKRVSLERHRFEGFVRFNYIENKFLYSSIEPDNNIVELLAEHFKKRFPNEYFIIHDIKREKAVVYNASSYEIVSMSYDIYEQLNSHDDEYMKLWKAYFKATDIDERKNLRLQCRMMPKRYWKHIFETNKYN